MPYCLIWECTLNLLELIKIRLCHWDFFFFRWPVALNYSVSKYSRNNNNKNAHAYSDRMKPNTIESYSINGNDPDSKEWKRKKERKKHRVNNQFCFYQSKTHKRYWTLYKRRAYRVQERMTIKIHHKDKHSHMYCIYYLYFNLIIAHSSDLVDIGWSRSESIYRHIISQYYNVW